jgi:anti-sigma regulatory factor (Ser/Thr protein kinase)
LTEETLRLRLAGGIEAPAMARSALRGMNGSLAGVSDSVRLLVSELVTNAVKYAGAGPQEFIEVELVSSPERVRVAVADRGPGFDPDGARQEPGGFGLLLVDEIADRWGIDFDHGSRVWFEIDLPASGGKVDRTTGNRS